MASSSPATKLISSTSGVTYHNSLTGASSSIADIPNGGSQGFNFSFADTGTPNQTMPLGTTVEVALSAGTLEGTTSFTVGNNAKAGFSVMNFTVIQEAGEDPQNARLTITITSPSGVVSTLNFDMKLL